MVYQAGGKDFQAQVQTNVPFLELVPSRSPFKDRYQIEVRVIPEKLKAGEVNGFIFVATNDPRVPADDRAGESRRPRKLVIGLTFRNGLSRADLQPEGHVRKMRTCWVRF